MKADANYPIPAGVNLTILAVAVAVSAACLALASQVDSVVLRLLCAVVFSYSANTLFSLLHEATHGILHPNPIINEWGGRIAAIFFPTSLTIQRAYHLTHHRNNRTVLERF